jgi:sec-independent protein translocase protein TatB
MGMSEMVFIFLLALILFGPKKLPEIGRQIGKFIAEFKRASNSFKYQLQSEMDKAGAEDTTVQPGAQQSSSFTQQSPSFTQTLLPPAVKSAISQIDSAHERLLQTARMAFDAQNYTTRPPETPVASATPETPVPLPVTLPSDASAPAAQTNSVAASHGAPPVENTTNQSTPDSAPAQSNSAPQSS